MRIAGVIPKFCSNSEHPGPRFFGSLEREETMAYQFIKTSEYIPDSSARTVVEYCGENHGLFPLYGSGPDVRLINLRLPFLCSNAAELSGYYRKLFQMASDSGLESIAVPLFPDREHTHLTRQGVKCIAIAAIRDFCSTHELTVFLLLDTVKHLPVNEDLILRLKAFITANWHEDQSAKETVYSHAADVQDPRRPDMYEGSNMTPGSPAEKYEYDILADLLEDELPDSDAHVPAPKEKQAILKETDDLILNRLHVRRRVSKQELPRKKTPPVLRKNREKLRAVRRPNPNPLNRRIIFLLQAAFRRPKTSRCIRDDILCR